MTDKRNEWCNFVCFVWMFCMFLLLSVLDSCSERMRDGGKELISYAYSGHEMRTYRFYRLTEWMPMRWTRSWRGITLKYNIWLCPRSSQAVDDILSDHTVAEEFWHLNFRAQQESRIKIFGSIFVSSKMRLCTVFARESSSVGNADEKFIGGETFIKIIITFRILQLLQTSIDGIWSRCETISGMVLHSLGIC